MAKPQTNKEIAKLLRSVAAAYSLKKDDQFRVIAYDRAASSIEHATSELKDLWDDGKLGELAGIGSSIASHLDELFRTGEVKHFKEVMKGYPPAMFELIFVPGIGPKNAYRLCRKLKITRAKTALEELEKAAKSGKIAEIAGFGVKSQQEMLKALEAFKKGQTKANRMVLPYADALAQELILYLKKCPAVGRADPLGSLRRKVATVGDIDIAVTTQEPNKVIDWFIRYPQKQKTIERGSTKASILLKNGRQVDLRVGKPKAYGAMLQYFIGSKHHNIHLRELALKKGLSLSEYGIKKGKKLIEYASEEAFYQALGLDWIPPELREDTGEIEVAQEGKLPNLVETADVKGDLHIHSDFPIETSHDEGADSIEEMLEEAEELGYEYLGFTEHNPSTSQHNVKQRIDLIKRKRDKIDKLNYSRENKKRGRGNKLPVLALNSLEIDIRPDGELAIPEKALAILDFAVVSIHSSFSLSRREMTKRVLAALGHPKVKILGHPTGRKINEREGFELDWEEIFDFCLKYDKWLEINAWPNRLDLPDTLVREAIKNSVKLVISTDAHTKEHLTLMEYGVSVARRGWAQKADIINTLGYNEFLQTLRY